MTMTDRGGALGLELFPPILSVLARARPLVRLKASGPGINAVANGQSIEVRVGGDQMGHEFIDSIDFIACYG